MATWAQIEEAEPAFAQQVQAVFDSGTNKTMATLRADGSPRISAVELEITDGQVSFGCMGGSVKLADVRRDPRIALHSPTLEPPSPEEWVGDAKLAGLAVEVPPPPDTPHDGAGFFVVDIIEVVHTRVGDPADHLVISTWHPDRGLRRVQRY